MSSINVTKITSTIPAKLKQGLAFKHRFNKSKKFFTFSNSIKIVFLVSLNILRQALQQYC